MECANDLSTIMNSITTQMSYAVYYKHEQQDPGCPNLIIRTLEDYHSEFEKYYIRRAECYCNNNVKKFHRYIINLVTKFITFMEGFTLIGNPSMMDNFRVQDSPDLIMLQHDWYMASKRIRTISQKAIGQSNIKKSDSPRVEVYCDVV